MRYTKEQKEIKKHIDSYLLYKRYQAKNLLDLVKHHRKTYEGENCSLSLYAILEAFEFYKGKKATLLEKKNFI